uniref:NADH-ubiquinone oxidoreductase chain 6 n=1 Tax=Demonax pseudonotabilis TaxID=2992285 RepID=A0A9E7V5X9_9CUCU|nr:NADH dehydrogenase subunit 6 [Demonax pseudonotabilis]UYX61168.1 NADH dehydrogenase subunit 6 [Demonax pseudonotabilis]
MMNILISSSLMLTIMFILLNHPLSFGMVLLLQTLLMSLITGMINQSFWFSYILFLIMVGGMLILFIYMTSIASNEKFNFSVKMTLSMMFLFSISLILMFTDKMMTNMKMINWEQESFPLNKLSLSKYINIPNNMIMMMVIVYLLITLIMVVKITNIKQGPLRQMF